MMALANWRTVCGRTALSASPSRRCRCQSSGLVSVICCMLRCVFYAVALAYATMNDEFDIVSLT